MKQFVVTGKEAREGLVKGINTVADAVVSTLGPNGRNVIFNKEYSIHSTKDGVSVAKSIDKLENPVEDLGANLIKQASIKTADKAGDGTTTSTLLAQIMVNEGVKYLNMGSNATDLKKGIELATKKITSFIRKEISEQITSEDQIKQIAIISSNGDEEIGELVSTSLSRVGRDGIVHIEESKTGETFLENVEGIQFDKGYISHYFVTNNETMTSTLIEPQILLLSKRISKIKDLLPLLESISGESKSLLIIAEDVEGEALATLLVNKQRGILKTCAVKAPDFGDRRKLFMEDIAIMTGATLIDPDKGMRLDRFDKNWLGTCRIATISKDTTTIIDGGGEEEDINKRIKEIQSQIEISTTPFEKEKLQERLAKLVGGVSIIHVGGNTEIEMKERKDRVEDALHATKAAIDEGIIPGGGVALLYAKKLSKSDLEREIIKLYGPKSDVSIGVNIVYKACSYPLYKIMENAGYSDANIYEVANYLEGKASSKINKFWLGYNMKSDKYENFRDLGIIDPTKVCIAALNNASSVASTILLTECVIVNKEDESDKKQNPMDFMM